MRRLTLAVILAALAAAPALADVVYLKNGGRVEGTVTDLGDTLKVEHRFGTVTLKKSEVAGIERKATVEQVYAERRAKTDLTDPAALVALGLWCRENGWETQAVKEFNAALAIDPDHRGARHALGHVFYEGAWRSEREIMEMKGFVLFEGQWVTREELLALKAAEAERKRVREIERTLNSAFRRLAGDSDRGRQKAYEDIVTLARELESPELEKYAGEAKAYYDQAWEIARRQMALMEIRAQLATLKRPIPTFQTSLGALSTPVNIQLPEMAVVSLGTTVPVPAGR